MMIIEDTHMICRECETGAHCMKNGCVPKQALAAPVQQSRSDVEPVAWKHAGAMPPEQEEMKEAAYNLARWLSAALDDSKVCQEYKDAINGWFDTAMPVPAAQPAPVQKPVGRVCFEGDEVVWTDEPPESGTLLYTTPPNVATPLDETASLAAPAPEERKRSWVRLTQEEIDIAFDDTQEGGGFDDFAYAIEAKLKAKNSP
jgi:hypothetical protein